MSTADEERDRVARIRQIRGNVAQMLLQRMGEAEAGHRFDPFRGEVRFSPGESRKRYMVYGALYVLHLYSLPEPSWFCDAIWLGDLPTFEEII